MGGLIVKQMLVHLNEAEKKEDRTKMAKKGTKKHLEGSVVENTSAIVFCSTPHMGSSIAKAMANFKFALLPSDEVVQLSSNSEYLVDLNKKFLDLIR